MLEGTYHCFTYYHSGIDKGEQGRSLVGMELLLSAIWHFKAAMEYFQGIESQEERMDEMALSGTTCGRCYVCFYF